MKTDSQSSNSYENAIILAMLACQATQLLQFWLGSVGEIIGFCGALLAIALSLLSPKAMFLLLFGLNYIPLSNQLLIHFRIYIFVYLVMLFRVMITPSVYSLFLGSSPSARLLRRWFLTWAAFAVLAGLFFLFTTNSEFGTRCAWDIFRGLGTSFIACLLAARAMEDIEENTVLPFAFVSYIFLGAILFLKMHQEMISFSVGGVGETRLGLTAGSDPNAIGMICNVGIGLCMGIMMQSPSWLLRFYALGAIILAARVVVMTGSRAGFLVFAAMVVAAIIINTPRLSTVIWRSVVIGSAAILTIIIILPFAEEIVLPRLESSYYAFEAGDLEYATGRRLNLAYWYLLRAADSGFIGAGFNYDMIQQYKQTVAHNTWIQVLSDFGIIGLSLLVLLTLPAFKLMFRSFRFLGMNQFPEKNKTMLSLRTGLTIAIIGLLLSTNTLTSTFEITFWWCMGYAVAFECRHRKAEYEDRYLLEMASGNDRGR